jgi:hypothetical protein
VFLSTFAALRSSAYKYGLTEGTEKASDIDLIELDVAATKRKDAAKHVCSAAGVLDTVDVQVLL